MHQNVQVYVLGGFDTSARTVATLHARGVRVVCYIDGGTWENWRPDAHRFPKRVLGKTNGGSGERWLDIRQIEILGPIMMNRFRMCKSKGFDAIDAYNVDGYTTRTGFPLTSQDQVAYNKWIASAAHSLDRGIALNRDTAQVKNLVGSFDFSLDDRCFQARECNTLVPFIKAGKAVFEMEYNRTPPCARATALRFSAVEANLKLDGNLWKPCW
jgi:hypothetical protein